MRQPKNGDPTHGSLRAEAMRRLVKECKIVQSRLKAIGECEDAMSCLTQHDVFGEGFAAIVMNDVKALEEAIDMGEADLGETVDLPD